MSKYQDWLIGHIEKNPDFIRPERYRNEVMALLKSEALEDLCISRPKSRLQWGITLPFDENYVTYVWFDALINYISALGYPDGEKFEAYWPVVQHIIAKDIVKPHGVFWPTMLKAAGIEPYRHLNVHGYWNMQDAKMSKSLGNVVTPKDLVDRYGNDQIRYFFLREMSFGNDARFSEDVIIDRINFDLGQRLGQPGEPHRQHARQVLRRHACRPSTRPSRRSGTIFCARFKSAAADYIALAKKFQTSAGLEKLWEFIRYLNKYIDTNKPWQLAEGTEHRAPLFGHEEPPRGGIYGIAVLLSPALVRSSASDHQGAWGGRKSRATSRASPASRSWTTGGEITDPGILFPRLEKKTDAENARAAEAKKLEGEKRGGGQEAEQRRGPGRYFGICKDRHPGGENPEAAQD